MDRARLLEGMRGVDVTIFRGNSESKGNLTKIEIKHDRYMAIGVSFKCIRIICFEKKQIVSDSCIWCHFASNFSLVKNFYVKFNMCVQRKNDVHDVHDCW